MKKIFFSLLFLITLFACERYDLSESNVVLLSPPNNQNDSIMTKLFWWEEVTGAKKYQIQIVSPSFDSIVNLILDSTITKTKFEKTLSPGTYQWRVRARSGATDTEWSTYNLVVKNTQSLAGQTIANMSPVDGYIANKLANDFTWDAMSKATSYLFKVYDSVGTVVIANQSVSTNSNKYTFTADGTYHWSVQAVNSISASYTGEHKIIIDTKAPNTPVLTWPILISDTVKTSKKTFTWDDGTLSGSVLTDSIWIGTDSLFATSIIKTTVTGTESYTPDVTTFATLTAGAKLFWRVRSKDAAGNVSAYSAVKSFRKE